MILSHFYFKGLLSGWLLDNTLGRIYWDIISSVVVPLYLSVSTVGESNALFRRLRLFVHKTLYGPRFSFFAKKYLLHEYILAVGAC